MTGLEMDQIDRPKLVLYSPSPVVERAIICRGLSRRIPEQLSKVNGLAISALDEACDAVGHSHKMITVNGIELCPVSAILFLTAEKDFRWSDVLELAINKILEVSRNESYSELG